MTKVTQYLRGTMYHDIMKNLPSRNYVPEIHKLVQDTIVEFMAPEVRAVYDNPELRGYLRRGNIEVRSGSNCVNMWGNDDYRQMYGITKPLTIQMDERAEALLVEGTMYHSLYHKLKKSGLVGDYFKQRDLRDSVSKRLKANLRAATTYKKLYEILEPELHHYIPKDAVAANLPATVAPVVDDLRKLGAVLPETPKAVGA